MSEHRPFTDEDGVRFYAEMLRPPGYIRNACGYKLALNAAFPEGKAVPQPAMRTTRVTAEDCECLVDRGLSAEDQFNNIERIVAGHLSGLDFSIILSRVWHVMQRGAQFFPLDYMWADAINETLGLREPLLVTDEDMRLIFNFDRSVPEVDRQAAKERLERIIRSKLPAST